MYKFRCSPDMRIGKVSCRRMLCSFLACLEMLKLPLDVNISDYFQLRHGVNKSCMYWEVFVRYNDWRVVCLKKKMIRIEVNQDRVNEFILYWIKARLNERILIGTFGTMRTDDEAA